MSIRVARLGILIGSLMLNSCVHQNWDARDRAGLQPLGDRIERLISVPLSYERPEDGRFDLYYFVRTPAVNKLGKKTVLFCGGGPGTNIRTFFENTFADFLATVGYNVVYFHLRGSGFSQIPPASKYDEFLRSDFAIGDIEAIRADLLGQDVMWDAIIAWSYGAVLAQEYASSDIGKGRVKKLILFAPISEIKEDKNEDEYSISRTVLENIYSLNKKFQSITDTGADKKILDQLFGPVEIRADGYKISQPAGARDRAYESTSKQGKGIMQKIEEAFGGEQYVIDEYCELKETGKLQEYGLDRYSRNFFRKLRELRLVGWIPLSALVARQVEIGTVIAVELNPELRKSLGRVSSNDGCSEVDSLGSLSQRLLYAMRENDGFWSRLERYKRAKVNRIRNLFKGILERRGNAERQWDPADHRHEVPTLLFKGGGDPATAGKQVERYYKTGFEGFRALIEFPGIGHELSAPEVFFARPYVSGTVRLRRQKIPGESTARVQAKIDNLTLKQLELNPVESMGVGLEWGNLAVGAENDISLEFANTASVEKVVPRLWRLRTTFLVGTLALDPLVVPPKQKLSLKRKIDVKLSMPRLEVTQPAAADSRLIYNLEIFKGDGPISYLLGMHNPTDDDIPIPGGDWKISNLFFEGVVKVRATTLKAHSYNEAPLLVTDVVPLEFKLIPPESMDADLSWEKIGASENAVTIELTNNTKREMVVPEVLGVINPFLTATLSMQTHVVLKPKSKRTMTGMIDNVTIRTPFELRQQVKLERGINPIAYSITGEDTVLVTLRNNNFGDVMIESGAWHLEGENFTGTAEFPTVTIPSKRTQRIRGKLNRLKLNPVSYTLIPPNGIESAGLEMLPVVVESENKLLVGVWNKSPMAIDMPELNWILQASNPEREGPCQRRNGISSRECLIYAFAEMEPVDFELDHVGILGALKDELKRQNVEVVISMCRGLWEESRCQVGNR